MRSKEWNTDDNQLASGSNDNKLLVWNGLDESPLYKFEHNAAVKALAWNPHQRELLASGGGTADRRIRFWCTLTGTPLHEIDTGSQVCNLAWSKNSKNWYLSWIFPKSNNGMEISFNETSRGINRSYLSSIISSG